MAHYDSSGNWVLDVGDDPNNPPSPPDAGLGATVAGESGYGPSGAEMFNWTGAPTPAGMTFKDYADYAYSHGLAGQDYNKGGIGNLIRDNGYMIPVLAAGAFGGLAALGSGAATGGLDAYMASAGLNPGTFEGAAFTMPSFSSLPIGDQAGDYPMPGEDGTAPQWKPSNINPTDVDKLLQYNADYATPSLSAKDILTNANRARQLANTLKSLTGSTGTTGTSLLGKQLASAISPVQQQFGGIYNMNQTPFLVNPQNNIVQNAPKTHDFLAELEQEGKPTLADLLRNA